MHRDRLLPHRWRSLTREVAAFGTIGVVNLFVNFGVFNLLWLTVLRSGELKAKAVATIVATTCAYFMNRHWTYRDRPKSTLRREYSLFFFFNLVGLIIEVAVVGVAKYGFHQTHIVVLNICTGLGILLGTIFRFWAYRTHVFREEPATLGTSTSVAARTTSIAARATAAPAAGSRPGPLAVPGQAGRPRQPTPANGQVRIRLDAFPVTAISPIAGLPITVAATRVVVGRPSAVHPTSHAGSLQRPAVFDLDDELDTIVALAEQPMGTATS